ncbi:mannonate dehydratase [Haloarchaeobius sp. TZWSO28]|uniref:mannonate dehydratase n=1 Tax=Haloarchaeobius sp. TZWSO28 TaxID=3446119 RepID=UPI003EBAC9C0
MSGELSTPAGPRIGFRTNTLSDERLSYIAQLGVTDVFINPTEPGGGTGGDVFEDESDRTSSDRRLPLGPESVPSVSDLVHLRRAASDAGVELAGVQSLGFNMYGDIKFDREGKTAQLDAIKRLIRNMGQAKLPILGYQWNPRGLLPMRTSTTNRIRGDARANAFDESDLAAVHELADGLDREYEEAELWNNYELFLDEVLPVAEDAGVTLALHPVDPPTVESLCGVPRLFRNPAAFERALELHPSDAHGLKLCLGCFAEMGEDVPDVIRRFGDDIVFVHFRNVVGTYPSFTETFVDDEAGEFDAVDAMRALVDVGFEGVIVPDHVPTVEGDTDWGHRARGFTAGYLKGVARAIENR